MYILALDTKFSTSNFEATKNYNNFFFPKRIYYENIKLALKYEKKERLAGLFFSVRINVWVFLFCSTSNVRTRKKKKKPTPDTGIFAAEWS